MDARSFRFEKARGNNQRETFDAKNTVRHKVAALNPDLTDTRQVIDIFHSVLPESEEEILSVSDQLDILDLGVDVINLIILDKIDEDTTRDTLSYGLTLQKSFEEHLQQNYDKYKNGILHAVLALEGDPDSPSRREREVEAAFGEFLSLNSLFAPHSAIYKKLLTRDTVENTARQHLAKDVIYHLTQEGLGLLGAYKDLSLQHEINSNNKQRLLKSVAGAITEVDTALLFWSLIESRRIKGWILPAGLLFNETYAQSNRSNMNADMLFVQPEECDLVGIQVKTQADYKNRSLYDESSIFLVDGVVDLGNYQNRLNTNSGGISVHPGNVVTIMHRILAGKNLPDDLRDPRVAYQNATTEQSARQERKRLQNQLLRRIEHSSLANAMVKAA